MKVIEHNKVAEYLRLSREDGDKMESDSIKNQRDLVRDYLAKHPDLRHVAEYVDDGYSGTNFERPGFQKMMKDIQAGKINCIIVKDLSRFGRNYIEVGKYLERLFPSIGVRLISILDQYDSAKENSDADRIIIPFKNLINDAYCRDLSMKVRSQLDVKRKSGKFIGSFTCYGYAKDPKDHNRLVVDPPAAEIVRFIYDLKLSGYNSQRIVDKLNEMGTLPPSEYKLSCGYHYFSGFRSGANPKWTVPTVNTILTNEMYTGTMVQGYYQKVSYKVNQFRSIPKDEWIRVPDTHEAIISRESFEKVQRLMTIDTRTSPTQDAVYMFSGLVRCGDCGQNMIRRREKRGDKVYVYLRCTTYKNRYGCSAHLINLEKLEACVLAAIRTQIALLLEAESILSQIDRIPENQTGVKVVDNQIKDSEAQIAKYKNLKVQAYMDLLDNVIAKEEYTIINDRFTQKMEAAQMTRQDLIAKRKRMLANEVHLKPWLDSFRKYASVQKLDRTILVELIDRICVYSKNRIEIHFVHEDEIQEIMILSGLAVEQEVSQ